MIFTASLHPSQTWLLRQLSFSSQKGHRETHPSGSPSNRQLYNCGTSTVKCLLSIAKAAPPVPATRGAESGYIPDPLSHPSLLLLHLLLLSLREHSSNQQGSRSLPPFSKASNARSHRAVCCLLVSGRSAGFPNSGPGPVCVAMVLLLPRPFTHPHHTQRRASPPPPHSSPGGCVESWACTLLPPQHSFCHPLGLASSSDCPTLLAHLLYVTLPFRSHSYPPGAHPFPQILQNPLLPMVGRWVSKRRKPMTGSVSQQLLTAPICYSASNTPFPRRQCRGISLCSGAGVSLRAPLCLAPPQRLPIHPWPPHKATGPWPKQCVQPIPTEVPTAPGLLA